MNALCAKDGHQWPKRRPRNPPLATAVAGSSTADDGKYLNVMVRCPRCGQDYTALQVALPLAQSAASGGEDLTTDSASS